LPIIIAIEKTLLSLCNKIITNQESVSLSLSKLSAAKRSSIHHNRLRQAQADSN